MSARPTEPELLREVLNSRLSEAHTSIPARVVSYDSAKQVADCEIVIRRAEIAESGDVVHEEYPIIPNCPVGWPEGGGYSLQFPLVAGDHVWLIFSEAAISQWRETGQLSNPGDLDRHDLSYPIAMPCARPASHTLPNSTVALLTVGAGGRLEIKTPGGVVDFVPLDQKLQIELARIQSDLTTLKAQLLATVTQADLGASFAGSPTIAAAVTSALSAVPSSPGATACTTLKVE